MTNTNVDVNLEPFATCSKFDNEPFVRRLSVKELLQLVLMGKHTTAFDKASIKLSLPQILWSLAWKLHKFTGGYRVKLYNKCVKKGSIAFCLLILILL